MLNLQRKLRYLRENIILLGIIPGPKEPKHTNLILQPFVNEMLRLWEGITMQTYDGITVLVRAAVICCACDIPAARKVCDFVGYAGIKGCSRCLLSFTTDTFGAKADYTNVNREEWPIRTKSAHLVASNLHKQAKTKTEQKQIERDTGVKYSILNDLPYFDAPRMCIVDPMHNLWLGTAKNLMELWKSSQLLTDKEFCIIQQRVNSFITPNNIGRIPSKIASNCAGFTAEQWKNRTIFFSLYALQGILPRPHYQCWLFFVKACYILCRQRISKVQLDEADRLLMMFYGEVVQLYGNNGCNMNLHLHSHMCDYIKDYGTVYSFWLFPLERLNGLLGSYPTNARNISIQIMQRFLDFTTFAPCKWPDKYKNDFLPVLEKHKYDKGSLKQNSFKEKDIEVTNILPLEEHAFTTRTITSLQHIVSALYPEDDYNVLMLHFRCNAITFNNFTLGTKDSCYKKTINSSCNA